MEQHTSASAPAFPTLRQAEEYIERAVNYEKKTCVKYDRRNFNLERMRLLLERMGNPHRKFRSVHVAGTKGKGSSATIVESCLRRCGFTTGLHTSPHLVSICERMVINGERPPESRFCSMVGEFKPLIDELRGCGGESNPTYFELTTALSFEMFARSAVRWAVVEVGLGGRLDATNVLDPQICLITPIGFDHMDKLGNTASQIAAEKAGILKAGTPLVLSRQDYPDACKAVRQRAAELGCPVWQVGEDIIIENVASVQTSPPGHSARPGWRFDVSGPGWQYKDLYTGLLGQHQVENIASALGVMELLKKTQDISFDPGVIESAVSACRCPARVELLQQHPPFILDTAHTPESMNALKAAVHSHFPGHRLHVVFGCSSDKNYGAMLEILAGVAESITLTASGSPRAEPAGRLAASARRAGFGDVRECPDPMEAVSAYLKTARQGDLVCATGSFFLAGMIREGFRGGAG